MCTMQVPGYEPYALKYIENQYTVEPLLMDTPQQQTPMI